MRIHTADFQIEGGKTNEHQSAMLNVRNGMMGYSVEMMIADGVFYLCERDGFLHIVGIPSESFASDIEAEGYRVIRKLQKEGR